MFFNLKPKENESDSDEENLFDSLAPIPSNNTTLKSVTSMPTVPSMIKHSSITSNTSNVSSRSRTPTSTKTRRRSNASRKSSVAYDDCDSFGDMALLKRLKTENKELRKSRNLLRKDHDILRKIESKLRHKLEIILAKFKQISFEFDDDNKMDYSSMQKNGDIEGVLEAVFAKFGQITDQFVKKQKIWKEQNKKYKDMVKKWYQFEGEYIATNRDGKGISHILSNSVGKTFETEYMFNCLKNKFDEINQEKTQKFKEYSIMVSKSQKNV